MEFCTDLAGPHIKILLLVKRSPAAVADHSRFISLHHTTHSRSPHLGSPSPSTQTTEKGEQQTQSLAKSSTFNWSWFCYICWVPLFACTHLGTWNVRSWLNKKRSAQGQGGPSVGVNLAGVPCPAQGSRQAHGSCRFSGEVAAPCLSPLARSHH